MNAVTKTLASSAIELAHLAGLELADWQKESLTAMLTVGSDSKWVNSDVDVVDHRDTDAILHVRALAGLLLLDERVIWSTYLRSAFSVAFDWFVALVRHLDEVDGVATQVKVVRRNGEEHVICERTGALVKFTRHCRPVRGYSFDTAIIQDAQHWTDRPRAEILPTLASASNPQIVYVGRRTR